MSALNREDKVLQKKLVEDFKEIIEKEGLKVVQDNWKPSLLRRAAAFHIKHEREEAEEFTSYEHLHDLVVRYYAWLNERKACDYTSKRRAGSMHRLMRYIDLKRELVSPGLQLMPGSAPQPRDPLSDSEVVELRLSFAVEKGSEHYQLFAVDDLPPHIKPWLEQVVAALGDDESSRFSETFFADMKRYADVDEWKAEKVIGYPKAARQLLNSVPPVVEERPVIAGFGDPTLVILDPDIPPRELGRFYDDIYIKNKANAANFKLWREALNAAQRDYDALTVDDFMPYFRQRTPELLVRDRPPEGYTHETMGERLNAYLPVLVEAFMDEKLMEFKDKRIGALEPEKVEANWRAKTGSEKRPPPPSLDQEILGRMAFDVCLEGLYFDDDGEDFLLAVWRKYRGWVESLGDQAEVLEVRLDYYNKPNETAPNLQKIRTNLNKLEKSIESRVKRPSPFRRSLHPRNLALI
jgi:hypothetical protein